MPGKVVCLMRSVLSKSESHGSLHCTVIFKGYCIYINVLFLFIYFFISHVVVIQTDIKRN